MCLKAVESVNTHQRLCISLFPRSSLYSHDSKTRLLAPLQLVDIEQIIQQVVKHWVTVLSGIPAE